MKYFISFICLSLFALTACASDLITASITVTNITTNGMTFTVNGSVRTFTNNVTISGTQVATNADATGCGSKTNLFSQISLNQLSQVVPINTGSNTFQLQGACGGALVVSASAGYATVTYSTQVCSIATPVGVPFSSYYPSPIRGTNTASQLALDIDNYDTNNTLLDLSKTQTVTGKKTFNNTNNQIAGIISSLAISGNSVRLTNGLYLTPILLTPVMTNGMNYGNPFSSTTTNNDGAEQYGQFASASGAASVALGLNAESSGVFGVAIGSSALASFQSTTAVGAGATASGQESSAYGTTAIASSENTLALGVASTASATNSTAVGFNATSAFTNSTALGANSVNTAANQIMLGAPGSSAVVPNSLSVGTNETIGGTLTITGGATIQGTQTNGSHFGTNNFLANSDIAFTRKTVSSLANGGNAAVPIGTNVFIEVSGPSGSFSIDGISNGRDGKLITILNQTGFQMTINNESGTDPTAANRIKTLGSAGNLVLTNAACMFIYNGNSSRWIMLSHNP